MVEINVAEQAQYKDLSRIQTKVVSSLDDILKSVALEEYAGVFKKENIDVEMLIDLDTDEFMNMTKEFGITTYLGT